MKSPFIISIPIENKASSNNGRGAVKRQVSVIQRGMNFFKSGQFTESRAQISDGVLIRRPATFHFC